MKVPPEASTDGRYRNVFLGSMADMFGRWVPEMPDPTRALPGTCSEGLIVAGARAAERIRICRGPSVAASRSSA
jgi:hypothetical protein